MSDLFLPTLEMMGLTFAIGFFVAFIIKLIASAADSLDFYSSHQQELLRLRRIKKFRQKMELMLHLVDYFYPEDTHMMYLEDAISHRDNKNKTKKNNDTKNKD